MGNRKGDFHEEMLVDNLIHDFLEILLRLGIVCQDFSLCIFR